MMDISYFTVMCCDRCGDAVKGDSRYVGETCDEYTADDGGTCGGTYQMCVSGEEIDLIKKGVLKTIHLRYISKDGDKVKFFILYQSYFGDNFGYTGDTFIAKNSSVRLKSNGKQRNAIAQENTLYVAGDYEEVDKHIISCTTEEWDKIKQTVGEYNDFFLEILESVVGNVESVSDYDNMRHNEILKQQYRKKGHRNMKTYRCSRCNTQTTSADDLEGLSCTYTKHCAGTYFSITESALDKQIAGDHYKKYKIQPIEFLHANNIPVPEAYAIKYILRHRDKNGAQDLDKAIHTLELLKELEYGNG